MFSQLESYRSGYNETDSKSVVPSRYRGFESHTLRQNVSLKKQKGAVKKINNSNKNKIKP